ncbi:metallophosphoesterase [Methylocystis sp. MJC1]|uniref:metallophosphoesterase family protein n=1 Tax=Methylocystis sp. MJC1 TaxID=2654282 RepID=UPI0013E9CEB3|nr:metallophosphoesterase [Methylocystis sp. MJC1]KAF2992851.1 3',5'-cyclic adenosine monophosphate phosphodiesterase CpdA [Methylocystis sp. MJC1]MBU6526810.1 metallophosphoesterase [Methylocystis sp. MJC1]UZX13244.1 metallophosphoesterase [Methylocystis sp. MJC1]
MSFLLAHLSDAHIGPIPRPNLADLLGKRVTGYVNWLYKRAGQHDMGVLARLVTDMRAQAPDHVLMTGDIVNIGLPAEIALAKDWLATLGAAQEVSFTPGNHDAYVADVTKLVHEVFEPWTTSELTTPGFPYLRRRSGVALIGLDSGVPTAPFVASGRLGERQLAALGALLDETKAEGLTRIVFLHHPPHVGGARLLRGLDDAGAFEAVIARHGAELVLHGHNHKPSVAYIASSNGRTPVVGVASASARPGGHYPAAAYNLYAIERAGEALRINLRRRELNEAGEVVEAGAEELVQPAT